MRRNPFLLGGMVAMLAAADRVGATPDVIPALNGPVGHSGHGSRIGNNKPQRDYVHEKRRRQIARASRQLNRRRSA